MISLPVSSHTSEIYCDSLSTKYPHCRIKSSNVKLWGGFRDNIIIIIRGFPLVCIRQSVISIFETICLSQSISVSLSRSVYLGLSILGSLSRSVYFDQSILVSLSLSVCLPQTVFLSLSLSVCLCQSILPVCLFLSILPVCLFLSVFASLSLSASLSV